VSSASGSHRRFGTGYSSLSYLRRFPVDAVKIDLLRHRPGQRPGADAIVAAVVNVSRALGLTVVAEGVETDSSWWRCAPSL